MTQIDLLTGEPVPAPRDPDALTDRQQFALELIGRLQPISSDELGALLCERHGNHAAADRCAWDRTNGNQMGEALRRKGLVRYRRTAGWTLTDWQPTGSGPSSSNPSPVVFRYRRTAGWTLTDWQPTGSGPSAQNTTRDGFDEHGFPRDF